nr:acyl-CoA dehydrogenase family protein [Kineosporia mesophila]
MTEADGGAHPTGVTAHRTGNGWELTGSKRWVVNAGIADHFLLTAAGDDGSRTAFVIDARSPGILTEEVAGPGAPWIAPVRLDRVQVHDDAVLGTTGAALTELVPVLAALDRSLMLTVWLGALQDLAEQTRVLALADGSRFGRPAGRSQAARFGLADLISHLDLFSGLVQRALWQFDARPEALRADGAAARLYLSLHIDTMLAAAGEVAGPLPGHRLLHVLAAAPLLRVASGPQITRPVLAAAMTGLGGSTILEETR